MTLGCNFTLYNPSSGRPDRMPFASGPPHAQSCEPHLRVAWCIWAVTACEMKILPMHTFPSSFLSTSSHPSFAKYPHPCISQNTGLTLISPNLSTSFLLWLVHVYTPWKMQSISFSFLQNLLTGHPKFKEVCMPCSRTTPCTHIDLVSIKTNRFTCQHIAI